MVVERNGNLDSLTIHVELSESSFTGEVRKLEALRGEISNAINSTLGIAADMKVAAPTRIERCEGKAKRVIDKRKLLD
jgi:phenylacetate-CoA ligase